MRFSTHAAVLAALVAPVVGAQAAETATVISSTPVMAQVAVPQQACNNEQQYVRGPTTGGGALLGAILGGVVGNTIGHGMGRAAATGVGVVAGSVIGNQVEANGQPPGEVTVQRCRPVAAYENRTVGYDVVYEYAGRRYTTRMANDPGPTLAIDVSPAGSPSAAVAPPAPPAYVQSYPVPPAPVVYAPAPAVVVTPYVGWGWRHRYWY
ncbi:MAG: glycine zipper 2TM domain-containing protein [Proteobacteria bacterium]|nr:glycine zipper 2TM domain-containing protein [Pseudomonadota bacterium]